MTDLLAAAQSGNRRLLLEQMRDRLASDMEVASPMVVAQIAGRLQAIAQELDELPLDEGVSASDDLAARRNARRAKAAADGKSAGGTK